MQTEQWLLPYAERKYQVYVCGNYDIAEMYLDYIQTDALEQKKISVLGFKHREQCGYGSSFPSATQQTLVSEVIVQVQRLLDQGVKPEHIELVGRSLGEALIPAVRQHFLEQHPSISLCVSTEPAFSYQQHIVRDWGGVALDTIELQPRSALPENEKKYRIKLLGWRQSYGRVVDELVNDVKQHQCHVVGFNHRGFNTREKKVTYHDLIQDGITQIEHLFRQGAREITLDARDLGEYVACRLVTYFKKQNRTLQVERKYPDLQYDIHTIITHDDASLDTMEIAHVSQTAQSVQDKKYLINFCGMSGSYQDIFSELQSEAYRLQCNVVGFNYRGVLFSRGQALSKDELVIDGIAQVQRLLNQGVAAPHIILKGQSLGGAVATLVAAYFHQKGIFIAVFNDRSFSSITNVLVGHIREIFNRVFGWIAKPFIKLALLLSRWEMDAGDAFKDIPETYRDYVAVCPKKRHDDSGIKFSSQEDGVIPAYASIHAALKDERTAKKKTLKTKPELLAVFNDKKANRKLIYTGPTGMFCRGVAHNASLSHLSSRSQDKTGEEIFDEFATKVFARPL
ncbi:MAG: hypothetical protein NTW08_08765 [Gammaproteobacteria bacterium]|nr:hypothetical protein [Gammaproteobacteria bacterium]